MSLIDLLTFIAMGIAGGVVIYTLYALSKLPELRDHRPLAPVVCLGIAFFLLKLQTVLGYPEVLPRVREIAWLLWELVALMQLGFMVWLHSKSRDRCPYPPIVHEG